MCRNLNGLNHDGELDILERALELDVLENIDSEGSEVDLPNGNTGEGVYFEPANYFPEELRRKYHLGEFADEE